MPTQRSYLHNSGVVISTTARTVATTGAVFQVAPWQGAMRLPTPDDLVDIYALEEEAYPADEAASEEGLKFRLGNASTFFRGFYCTEALAAPAGAIPTVFQQSASQSLNPSASVTHPHCSCWTPLFLFRYAAPGELLGFVCATLASGEELLEETMTKHDPAGTTLCIHSVVCTHAMRRRGVAQQMLSEYIAHVKVTTQPIPQPIPTTIRFPGTTLRACLRL